ncbi:MAG: DUF3024 domain-containing protein [bacterium]|nr:MAG: DUF3024 domain-containing protein [bacterium]
MRDKVRLKYKIRGNNVTLFEERPTFTDPSLWIDIKLAQFRFDPSNGQWSLYYADRNSRWHQYFGIESTRAFDTMLNEVDDDPTGIFWG